MPFCQSHYGTVPQKLRDFHEFKISAVYMLDLQKDSWRCFKNQPLLTRRRFLSLGVGGGVFF